MSIFFVFILYVVDCFKSGIFCGWTLFRAFGHLCVSQNMHIIKNMLIIIMFVIIADQGPVA